MRVLLSFFIVASVYLPVTGDWSYKTAVTETAATVGEDGSFPPILDVDTDEGTTTSSANADIPSGSKCDAAANVAWGYPVAQCISYLEIEIADDETSDSGDGNASAEGKYEANGNFFTDELFSLGVKVSVDDKNRVATLSDMYAIGANWKMTGRLSLGKLVWELWQWDDEQLDWIQEDNGSENGSQVGDNWVWRKDTSGRTFVLNGSVVWTEAYSVGDYDIGGNGGKAIFDAGVVLSEN